MLRLPEEIQVDIFLRLPVKSILRCRCICKPLCRLLYNPKFINYHLNHHKKKPNLMLISDECCGRAPECCLIDHAPILSASTASALSTTCSCDGATPFYNICQSEWAEFIGVVGSCNGLICINIQGGPRICILNPATGKYNQLILSGKYRGFPSTLTFGFGYDCRLDVYKLMKIVADGLGYCYSQVQVCSLIGNMSWKTIQTMHRYTFIPQGPPGHFSVWFLNGALHWKGFIIATSSWVIVSFNMSTDRFVDFAYPEEVNPQLCYSAHYINNGLRIFDHLGILEDRLCLVVYDARKINNCPLLIDVWLMQDYGVSESWTKRYSLKPSCTIQYPLGKLVWSSSTNGEVLLLIDGGYNKLLYDPKNDSIRLFEVPIFGSFRTGGSRLVSYVESLVSPLSRTTFLWERNANEVTKKQRLE